MLRMTLLGEQALIDDQAGSVQVRSSRAVALIAFLAVHAGSPQPRQRIAGLLWPDSADAQALTNLRRELHHLRQVLGGEASLVVTPRELCWSDTGTCVVDVRVFDRERAGGAGSGGGRRRRGDPGARRGGGRRVPGRPAPRGLRGLAPGGPVPARTPLRGAVRPARRHPVAHRRPGRRRSDGPAPGPAGAAGGGRLPGTHAVASGPGRPGRGHQHVPSLRLGAGTRAGRPPRPRDSHGLPAPDGAGRTGRARPGAAARGRRGRARRAGSRAGHAARRVAGGRDGLPWPGARPGRTRRREDPPGDRGGRDRPAAGRGGGDRPVLRRGRAAGAGPGGGLAASRGGPVGGGDPRPGLAGGSRPAAAGRGRRRRHPGDDRRLAAAPVLRGADPGADRGQLTAAAGAGQYAVVRPGDAGVRDVLSRPGR